MGHPPENLDESADPSTDGTDGWLLTLAVEPDRIELVGSLLWDAGTTGLAEVDGRLVAGFPDRAAVDDAAARAADWPTTVVAIEPVSWTGDDRLSTVTVDGGPGSVEPITLAITAGPTFGHGAHPTTALALTLLTDAVRRRLIADGGDGVGAGATGGPAGDGGRPAVLDVGTGSGVLAIAAAVLGADPVIGIDIDPAVPDVARANARANGVEITVSSDEPRAAAATIDGAGFDLVVANVLLPTQRELAPVMAEVLAPGGSLVTAGYLDGDEAELVDLHRRALGAAGHGPVTVGPGLRRDGWAAHRFDVG